MTYTLKQLREMASDLLNDFRKASPYKRGHVKLTGVAVQITMDPPRVQLVATIQTPTGVETASKAL